MSETPGPRRRRSLSAIRADLAALGDGDRVAITEYLLEKVPDEDVFRPRFLTGSGPNAAAIFAFWAVGHSKPHRGPAQQRIALEIAALWCQDHPRDLVHPRWAPSLDVPGDIPC